MQKSPIVRLRAPRLRRFVSLLTLVGYFVICTGLPVPFAIGQTTAEEASATTPYPCQGHRCGCRSAEQCWKACCCMSDLEKRMWAERNGVPLPDYLLSPAAVVAEVSSTTVHQAEPAARSCCKRASSRSPAKPTNCGACPTEVVASSTAVAAPATSEVVWISYLASQRCSGGATDIWAGGPTGLPAGSSVVLMPRFDEVRPLVATIQSTLEASFSFPPLRPPRIA